MLFYKREKEGRAKEKKVCIHPEDCHGDCGVTEWVSGLLSSTLSRVWDKFF
jgi:hypothetical protein